jgi:uncharacterized protein (TIGR00290 family)
MTMPMIEKILLCWSGGKDSAFALHELQKANRFEVAALITTVTEGYDRISMHGVRRTLLEQQAASLGIPLEKVVISQQATNEEYGTKMQALLESYLLQGITKVAFGDLFLEDLRKYREKNLAKIGMSGVFPIWKRDTTAMAREFISLGFRTVICCVDAEALDGKFVGRNFDAEFLAELPKAVDPCGENGEFHSFVYDGPIFKNQIPFEKGEIVLRDKRFYYCDLIPTGI